VGFDRVSVSVTLYRGCTKPLEVQGKRSHGQGNVDMSQYMNSMAAADLANFFRSRGICGFKNFLKMLK